MSSVHPAPPPPVVEEPNGFKYATGTALGKGGFAICYRAERLQGNKPTGHCVALKIVKTKMEPAKLAQKFVTELQIHSKLSHPNIVAFYRAFSFQTSTYVVLELCSSGSLADMLKKRQYLTLPEIRRFVIQICGAVKYLHHRHIVHRDLKTGNLFLDENMDVKVGDFGLAALIVTEREMEVKRRTTMCGTPNYLAPEILEKGKGHNEKVDIWSIGVIIYTLAVGKAPFHASSKEEIYKKLRSGEYAWPELNASSNDISSDLRDLVAGILVPEEDRPNPDKLVSHPFFKIAYVPANIAPEAREKVPQWPDATIPSAETRQRGYSETWWRLCRHSGVGELSDGKCFPLNSSKRIRSIVYDMAKEAQAGRQPSMPIPKDVVYVSSVSSWQEQPLHNAEPHDSMSSQPVSRGIREISSNQVATTRTAISDRDPPKTDAEKMPPPPRPASRASRTGTMRKAARTISDEVAARAHAPIEIAIDEPTPQLQPSKTRQAPEAPDTQLKASSVSTNSASRSLPSAEPDTTTEKSSKVGPAKRSADASLARRPRMTQRQRERPASPGPLATLDELKHVSPMKRPKRKQLMPDAVEVLSDAEPENEQAQRPFFQTALELPPPPRMTRTLPKPRMATAVSNAIRGTDPDTVLLRLTKLRDNLSSALTDRGSRIGSGTYSRSSDTPPNNLPFVARWVDYSRKHGVGYVLEDGTIGCIINASTKLGVSHAVSHVLVRDGQRWLGKVGKNFEHLDRIPIEVFEDQGATGIFRKVYKGLGSVKEGPHLAEAERRKTLSVLWCKFGRYMCQTLATTGDYANAAKAGAKSENFVRFYQRIGNVGIWMFADGCLQVHFPDHTKMVISADGKVLSATCITPEAAAYLSQNGELLPHHVNGREVHSDSIFSLLREGGRLRQRIIKANQLPDKLVFILELVSQWVSNGGVGRVDEDEGVGEKMCWKGTVVKDTAQKVDRVTVGRYGGDLPPVAG